MALKLRRGLDADRVTSNIEQGEIVAVFDPDPTKTNRVYLGDGFTPGGILVGPTTLSEESTPRLGGNLDLNGRNIIGTGNINITGNITATGNINLGDNAADNISVLGLINSTLTPAVDDLYNLGTVSKQWANIWATQVNVDTTLAVGSQIVKLSGGTADSSLVLWDSETDTVTANQFVGNLTGSVFGDDTTALVDGVAGKIVGNVENISTTSSDINGAVLTLSGLNSEGTKAGIAITTDGNQEDNYDLFTVNGATDGTLGPAFFYQRSRGTIGLPGPLVTQDEILTQYWVGTDSDSQPALTASLVISVDETPTAGVVPGRVTLSVADATGVLQPALSIGSNTILDVLDNTVIAGSGAGEVNLAGGVATYLRINVDGAEYALPLYGLNP
jgi:hypothetical protein